MPVYKIYHPVNGMNHRCLQGVYEYYEVCQVEAATLNKVFFIGQNGHSDDYTAIGTRSTSVGDIIVDVQEDKHYMVMGGGFQEIPSTVTHYKKPVEDDGLKWLSLDEVVSASLPDDIIVDEEGELASFDYYTGIKVAKNRGLVQGVNLQEVRQGTHFIVCCGDVMFSVNSDEYPQVARRSLI